MHIRESKQKKIKRERNPNLVSWNTLKITKARVTQPDKLNYSYRKADAYWIIFKQNNIGAQIWFLLSIFRCPAIWKIFAFARNAQYEQSITKLPLTQNRDISDWFHTENRVSEKKETTKLNNFAPYLHPITNHIFGVSPRTSCRARNSHGPLFIGIHCVKNARRLPEIEIELLLLFARAGVFSPAGGAKKPLRVRKVRRRQRSRFKLICQRQG